MSLFGPPDVEKLKAKRDVNGLIKALSYQKSGQVRREAAEALGKIGDARAIEPLIAALKAEHKNDYRTRLNMIDVLGDLGDSRAIPALLELAADDTDDQRVWAAYSLAKLGERRAIPFLLSALEHRYNRELVLRGLRHLRSIEAVIPLVRILKEEQVNSNKSALLWLEVVDTLGAIGDPRAVDALLNWKSNEDAKRYYLFSHDGIARRFTPRVVDALTACGQQAVPTLVSNLLESRGLEAALALGKLGWTPGTDDERLAYALARGEWVEAARVGAIALNSLLLELGFELVNERWVNRSGAFGNGDIDGKETKKIIAIAKALGVIGDARAVEPLKQILSSDLRGLWISGNSSIRAAVSDALELLKS